MILLDTTVLNNFSNIERPDLVRLVLADAATTTQVLAEVEHGVAAGHVPSCDWRWLEVVHLTPLEQEELARTSQVLGAGEASCIAVAIERNASLFSDDLQARHCARRRGLTVSGTLGVLYALVVKGHLSTAEADKLLQQMISRGYRAAVHSLADLSRE